VVLFFPALGMAVAGACALFAVLLGLALLAILEPLYPVVVPVVDAPAPRQRLRGAAPALVASVLTVVCVAIGLVVDRFDAPHPAPEHLMYVLDADTGQARWVSADSRPGSWNSQYVSKREDIGSEFPSLGGDVWTGPARVANLPAPVLTVVSDSTSDGRRTLTLNLKPQRPVRLIYLRVDDATTLSATVDSRPIAEEMVSNPFELTFHAPPADGVPITLVLDKTGPVRIRVADGSDGLDALPGFTPRPADIGVAASHTSELVLVAKTYTL
jgi:hypothetical protein